MHIQACRVKNYRSFRDSGDIRFAPGFNLIVGPNNVGKTALLNALELQSFGSIPHRDPTIPRGVTTDPNSWMSVEVVTTGPEVRSRILSTNATFAIPITEAVA